MINKYKLYSCFFFRRADAQLYCKQLTYYSSDCKWDTLRHGIQEEQIMLEATTNLLFKWRNLEIPAQ